MAERIGLIQTRGIGDIIIALPIADHFIGQGCEVFWPIDLRFIPFVKQVAPHVNFLPVEQGAGFFDEYPMRELRKAGVDRTIMLYSYLTHRPIANPRLAQSLKFDEYKYAIAGVPFVRKWELSIKRDMRREMALHEKLNIRGPYICIHTTGSDFKLNLKIPDDWSKQYQIVQVSELTENPFDWIYTFEHAAKLAMIDSCFSNLVEQLNIPNEKYFICRSPVLFTPVMKNGWKFITP